MPTQIRVLFVEDNPDDAELMHLDLTRGGFEIDWKRVETAEEMRAALSGEPWDVVLSDDTLPQFGVLDALAVVSEFDTDLPVVVVSSTADEDQAVAVMRAGARDCVLKRNRGRLALTVERELRAAGDRRARGRAERAVGDLAALVESSDDAILSKTVDGAIDRWNPAAEQLYGWTAPEVIGRPFSLLVPEDRRKELAGILERLNQGQRVERFETVRLHRDGTRIDVSLTISPVRDGAGRIVGVLEIARDISGRKGVEVNRALLAALVESAEMPIVIADPEGFIQDWNPSAVQMFGYSAQETIGKSSLFQFVRPDLLGEYRDRVEQVKQGERFAPLETICLRKGGEQFYASVTVSAVRVEGQVVALTAVCRDTTAWREAEEVRKRAEEAIRASEERYRAVVEDQTEVVCRVRADHTFRFVNGGFCRLLGKTPEELIGQRGQSIAHPDDLLAVQAALATLSPSNPVVRIDNRVVDTAGRVRWMEFVNRGFFTPGGDLKEWQTVGRDITERKLAEDALRESEERYRQLADAMPQIVWVTRQDGHTKYCNQRWYEYTGLSDEQTDGEVWPRFFHPDDLTWVWQRWQHSLTTGEPYEVEYRCRRHDGEYRWFLGRAVPQRDREDRVVRWFGTCTDIHDRKLAEEAVLHSEERLRQVIESNIVGVFFWDESGGVTDANDAYLEIIGYSRDDLREGRVDWAAMTPPEHLPADERALVELGAERRCHPYEKEYFRKDGSRVPVLVVGACLNGRAGNGVAFALDLSPQKKAQREAAEHLALLETLLFNAPIGLAFVDPDYRFARCNEALAAMTGLPSAAHLGRQVSEVVPHLWPRLEPAYRQVMESGLAQSGIEISGETAAKPGQTRHHAVSLYPVRVGGTLLGVGVVVVDLTDRRSLEEQLRHAQKMEAVGRLAGGVAHDFNNLLTIISGYSDLLLHQLPQDDPSRFLVEEIHRAGERSAALTRQLLVFSRRQVVQPRILDLNEVVANAEKMLRRIIGEDVHLETVSKPLAGRVKADPSQLEQVLLNLAVNARDAMPQGGRLTIQTADATLGKDYARLQSGGQAGPHVLLTVSDTGCGMADEVKARIFEPFFTTKEAGKGTGLGLAVVHGIVQQAGGHIVVHSEAGKGTTFEVYLPCVDQLTQAGKPRLDIQPPPQGSETVLLVEDEDGVRALTRHVLQGCGYAVLEAADGYEALRIAGQSQSKIHLLLTDVVMPGLGGRQLAERIVEIHPTAKVLYISGYTDDAVVRHGVLEEQVHFLQKPFSPLALARKVREVLDLPGKPAGTSG